jgi:hypothetical protein
MIGDRTSTRDEMIAAVGCPGGGVPGDAGRPDEKAEAAQLE